MTEPEPSSPPPGIAAVRRPVRAPVLEQLTAEIVRGDLPPDEPVNVARVAERYGVSVTPVREALIELAGAGLAMAPLGRGFVVPPLSAREVREIYPLIWTLEVLALREAPPDDDAMDELEELQAELASEADPDRALALDRRWHTRLLAAYDNDTHQALLAGLKNRAARYEHAYMRERARVLASVEQHHRILDALGRADTAAAAAALEENWRVGPRFLLPWLETP